MSTAITSVSASGWVDHMAGNSGDPGRTVASKVAVILATFAAGAEHTLSQIAHETSLPVSTVHRLLRDLVAAELLDRCGDGGYRAAWPLRTLKVDPVEPTLADRAPLVVDDLAAALQTTARVGVLDALEISYVEKVPGLVCGTSFPNTARLPLHATALGKALLAFLRPVVVRLVIAQGLSSYTPHTVVRADQLQCALQQARMRGFATSAGELDVGCAVAVPVFDADGGLIAGVEVQVDDLAGPTLARVLPSLVLAARGLSRELAAGRWRPQCGPSIRSYVHAPAGIEQGGSAVVRSLCHAVDRDCDADAGSQTRWSFALHRVPGLR